MIALQSVPKQFQHRGKPVVARANVSLEIARGDFVAIVGPSGSGKSTLLHWLGGMLSPTNGKVRVENDSLYDLTPEQRSALRRKKIGFLFQIFNLVPYLTALENVQVSLVLAGLDEAEQQRRAEALLGRVGLSDRLDHKPRELNVGQQQRVALARMLANAPSSWRTNRPATSTPKPPKASWAFLPNSTARAAPSSWSHTTSAWRVAPSVRCALPTAPFNPTDTR